MRCSREGRLLLSRPIRLAIRLTEHDFIRFIREKYPVKSEKVEGELYHRYWIDEAYLAELKEVGKQVSEGTFFSNLLAV